MGFKSIDIEAFERIAKLLEDGNIVNLSFGNRAKALSFRHKFYTYRKMEQSVRNDPFFLSQVMVKLEEDGTVTLTPKPIDLDLRRALGME